MLYMKRHEIEAELRTLYKDLEVLENGTEQEICEYFNTDPDDILPLCREWHDYIERLEARLAELEAEDAAEWADYRDEDAWRERMYDAAAMG